MKRLFAVSVLGLLLAVCCVRGQNDIQRGRIKTVDADKLLVTVTSGDKDFTLTVIDETKLFDGVGKTQRERLQAFKPGADVMFKVGRKDDSNILIGLKLAGAAAPKLTPFDSSKLKPLTELGAGEYQGVKGGLYPEGKNERPAAHEAAGLALAKQVQPLDGAGKPNAAGKIVLLSVGMSNTSQASQGFTKALAGASKNPQVVFVNGAQGGMTAAAIENPDEGRGVTYWSTVDERLKGAGLTPAQVQVVWIKQADAGPSQGFPAYAKRLQAELANIVQILPRRYPNVKLAYLSSRTYGGYAKSALNPEPYAYESGLAVKWLIEQQLQGELNFDAKKGDVKAPWLSWGPYLWANGANKRSDGFSYEEADFTSSDGTHLSPSGIDKVGRLMLQFFQNDATTRPWFVGAGQ